MCEKIQNFWNSLDVNVKVNKRELLLGVTACTLMGVVVGMLVSPRKNVTAGCHNGCNNVVDKRSACDEALDEPEEDNEDVGKF